jgi:curved DNA-binding protein CbpA
MDYYEELGVSQSASPDEIRRAYRALVRLLHPDRHQGEDLRRAAERQLQRVQSVVAVLLDNDRRRQYDNELAVARTNRARATLRLLSHPQGLSTARVALSLATWIWLGAAACGILGIASLLREQATPEREAPPDSRKSLAAPARAERVAVRTVPRPNNSRTAARTMPQRSTAWVYESIPSPPASPGNPEAAHQIPPVHSEVGIEQLHSNPQASSTVPAEGSADPQSLAGHWIFTRNYYAPEKDLYPPEYIELTLVERGDHLTGQYSARYFVGDKPVSPHVAFIFDGAAPGKEAEFPWTAPSGAQGRVQLDLQFDESLVVTWWATRSGSRPELTSGTAVLIRLKRQEHADQVPDFRPSASNFVGPS